MDIAAVCLVITALLAYINHRFIKLPTTIGVMSIALGCSALLVSLDHFGVEFLRQDIESWFKTIDFSEILMQGMLSLLLFAGSLHIDASKLKAYRLQITTLAVFGTLLSMCIVGMSMWLVLPWFGVTLPLIYCLVFGALISPTDPVAVMGLIQSAGAPKNLEIVMAGESLFNDGIGVVLFALTMTVVNTGHVPSLATGALLLLQEAGGGIALGLLLGLGGYKLLKTIDSYQEEILITLAIVTGGYALADRLHFSGPLAMVVTGLIIGNRGRAFAMSETTRNHLDTFWELIDSVLNSVLFVLIGLELILIKFASQLILPALAAILFCLLARYITVAIPIAAFQRWFGLPRGAGSILTWGGLRGGISVALALSLPGGNERNIIVTLTYAVVIFSILVQGLTMPLVTRRALKKAG